MSSGSVCVGWFDPFWKDIWRHRFPNMGRLNDVQNGVSHLVEKTIQNMLLYFYLTVADPSKNAIGEVLTNTQIQSILAVYYLPRLFDANHPLFFAAVRITEIEPDTVEYLMVLSENRGGSSDGTRTTTRLPVDPWAVVDSNRHSEQHVPPHPATRSIQYVIRIVLHEGLTSADANHSSYITQMTPSGVEVLMGLPNEWQCKYACDNVSL